MTMSEVTVARYLVSRIEALGIQFVPVLQGSAIMKMIDEIGQSDKITYVSPHHEQSVSMMAESYGRLHGISVGMATSGPGALNMATGIACAYYDSIPCIFITGQVGMFHVKDKRRVRQRGFQETDVIDVFKSITKWSTMMTRGQDAKYIFDKAVHIATTGRPGPVLIDLPFNVQRELISPESLRSFKPEPLIHSSDLELQVQQVVEAIQKAKKPAILVGGGIHAARQVETLRELVNDLKIPVTTTWAAADVFEDDDPYYMGDAGQFGNPCSTQMIQECDLILCLGTRLTPRVSMNEKLFAENAKIIGVDIDAGELHDGLVSMDMPIVADLKDFLPLFMKWGKASKELRANKSEWFEKIKSMKRESFSFKNTTGLQADTLHPHSFMKVLSKALPENANLILDTGQNLTWSIQGLESKIGQRVFSALGCSPMGYALPASIGSYYADKSRIHIAIMGDGGLHMNIQELQTIVAYKLPIKIIVMNNECYGNIKFAARVQFEGRTYANEPTNGYYPSDITAIAKAFGLNTHVIDDSKNLDKQLHEILASDQPEFIELRVDSETTLAEPARQDLIATL